MTKNICLMSFAENCIWFTVGSGVISFTTKKN